MFLYSIDDDHDGLVVCRFNLLKINW